MPATMKSGTPSGQSASTKKSVGSPKEATAQLDGITEAAIQNVISKAASTGTVITIAHRLSTVLDADQIIVLENGRIRNRGTHHDLLNNDELYHEFITALKISAEEGR